jgi:hypothetical protein
MDLVELDWTDLSWCRVQDVFRWTVFNDIDVFKDGFGIDPECDENGNCKRLFSKTIKVPRDEFITSFVFSWISKLSLKCDWNNVIIHEYNRNVLELDVSSEDASDNKFIQSDTISKFWYPGCPSILCMNRMLLESIDSRMGT